MTLDPNQHLTFQAKFVEATLETLLATQALPDETVRPQGCLQPCATARSTAASDCGRFW